MAEKTNPETFSGLVRGKMNGHSNMPLAASKAINSITRNYNNLHGSEGVLSRQGETVGMSMPTNFPEDNPMEKAPKTAKPKVMKSMKKFYNK
jgi:hypothetical protein